MSEIRAGSPVATVRSTSPLALAAFIAAMLTCGLYAAFIAGPAMRAVAGERLSQDISAETKAFCETLGMRAGTAEFVKCSDELAAVRQKQTDRDRAADAGIL
jgi:hypothetical protein